MRATVQFCSFFLAALLAVGVNAANPYEFNTPERVVAFAGIANPEGFFQQLREGGVNLVETIALPDHVEFGCEVQSRLVCAVKDADFLVTTEKDAVKLDGLNFPVPCCQVVLELKFQEGSTPLDRVLNLLKEDLHDSE